MFSVSVEKVKRKGRVGKKRLVESSNNTPHFVPSTDPRFGFVPFFPQVRYPNRSYLSIMDLPQSSRKYTPPLHHVLRFIHTVSPMLVPSDNLSLVPLLLQVLNTVVTHLSVLGFSHFSCRSYLHWVGSHGLGYDRHLLQTHPFLELVLRLQVRSMLLVGVPPRKTVPHSTVSGKLTPPVRVSPRPEVTSLLS